MTIFGTNRKARPGHQKSFDHDFAMETGPVPYKLGR